MELPHSLTHLADSVGRFLASRHPSSVELVGQILDPLGRMGEVCVIGGLVRDLAFYGPEERPISDVDLVVKAHPSRIAAFAESVGATRNRFGGYGLRTTAFKADFWAFSSTWAKQEGHVALRRTSDLWKCTFFDWDAVVYSMRSRRVFAIPRYLERMNSRTLDINLEPSPSEKGNLVRALRRLVMWDAQPGPRLRKFIATKLPLYSWQDLVDAEASAFHVTFLQPFDNENHYTQLVLSQGIFPGLGRDDRRQRRFDVVSTAYRQPFPEFNYADLSNGAYIRPEKFDVPKMPTENYDLFAEKKTVKR